MNGLLIIGGIYLTSNDNYLVVVSKENRYYYIVSFNKNNFSQNDLLTKEYIPQEEYESYYMAVGDRERLKQSFNNGYCGKITDKFLNELQDVFKYCKYLPCSNI